MQSAVSKLLRCQCEGLDKVLRTPDHVEPPPDTHEEVLGWALRSTYSTDRDARRLQECCPLISQVEYPSLTEEDLHLCLPLSIGLRAALALVVQLEGFESERAAVSNEYGLAVLLGTDGEPFAMALHRILHKVCCRTDDGLGVHCLSSCSTPPPPLLQCATEIWQSLIQLHVPEPFQPKRSDVYVAQLMGTPEVAEIKTRKMAETALAWLRAQSTRGLRSVLSTAIVELEAVLARAEEARAQAERDLSEEGQPARVLPAAAWRAFIVDSEGMRLVRDLPVDRRSYIALDALNNANCLVHFSPRGFLAALELALTEWDAYFLKALAAPELSADWRWRRELRTPFSGCEHDEKFVAMTELFQVGAGRVHVVAIMQQLDDEVWEPDQKAITSSRVLQWMAVHVLDHTRPIRKRNNDDDDGDDGSPAWEPSTPHPAWEPGALTEDKHAMPLAVQMNWRPRWFQLDGYSMLLSDTSTWQLHDAAALIHKALRIPRAEEEYLPN